MARTWPNGMARRVVAPTRVQGPRRRGLHFSFARRLHPSSASPRFSLLSARRESIAAHCRCCRPLLSTIASHPSTPSHRLTGARDHASLQPRRSPQPTRNATVTETAGTVSRSAEPPASPASPARLLRLFGRSSSLFGPKARHPPASPPPSPETEPLGDLLVTPEQRRRLSRSATLPRPAARRSITDLDDPPGSASIWSASPGSPNSVYVEMAPLSPRLPRLASENESSSRDGADDAAAIGDFSLPPEQRRHLMEMESSFLPGNNSPVTSIKIGGMGPPPLPVGRRRPPSSSSAGAGGTVRLSQRGIRAPLGGDETDDDASPSVAAAQRNASRAAAATSALSALFSAPDDLPLPSSPSPQPLLADPLPSPAVDAAKPDPPSAPVAIPSKHPSAPPLAGNSRSRRPKFLRSRHSSHRSSMSSASDVPGDDDEVNTVTAAAADPALSRSTSLGSIASGVTALATGEPFSVRNFSSSSAAERALARLDEEERNSRKTSPEHNADLSPDEKSKPKKEGTVELPTTPEGRTPDLPPTDTVVNAQAKNMQVPPTVAREYSARLSAAAPMSPSKKAMAAAGTPGAAVGKNMTLKEQTAIIDRLQKENFDLKLKLYYLDQRLDKLSDEGVKEMMQDNVDMKIRLTEVVRERKALKKRVRELEKKIEDLRKEGKEAGEDQKERDEEMWELRETVERYELEIEEYRQREREREERMREARRQANGNHNEELVSLLSLCRLC